MRTQAISIKLKLEPSVEQKKLLMEFATAYVGALNFISKKVHKDLNKTQSNKKIQEDLYHEVREKFLIGAQTTCSACQQVASSYKQLWTTAKKHAQNVKKGWTKKLYRGLDKAPEYKSPTVTMQYNRDYSWSKNQEVSVGTMDGRIKLKYHGWNKHLEMIKEGAPTGAAKLWYDKTSKQWYLIVSIELQREDIDPRDLMKVKGVDVGQRCLAVSTTNTGETNFVHGGQVKSKCRHYQRVRKGLQSKGTRSSKKVLARLSMRERRFRSDVNHKLAHSVLEESILVGMEDLGGCRENTIKKRKKARNGATAKQTQATRESSSWSYAEAYQFVSYKSFFYDSVVVQVDARNTSKGCSKCGNVDDGNRPGGALIFKCTSCGHTVHSDKNGSDNILVRTLLKRQDLLSTGRLSTAPGIAQVVSEVPGVDGHQSGVKGQAVMSFASR
jgi:predicted transposase